MCDESAVLVPNTSFSQIRFKIMCSSLQVRNLRRMLNRLNKNQSMVMALSASYSLEQLGKQIYGYYPSQHKNRTWFS